MMGGAGVGGMAGTMGSSGMNAMHDAMHETMRGVVSDEVLAACDTMHDAIWDEDDGVATQRTASVSQHALHHGASRP